MTSKTMDQLKAELIALSRELGKTPGRRTFEARTATPQSQWLYHWPRWSEFVADAGLQENSPRPKADPAKLLEQLAGLVRKLQRFPSYTELRIYRRKDASVPSEDTLRKYFGHTKTLRGALRDFCIEHDEFSDLADLIASEIGDEEHDEGDQSIHAGVVYLYLIKFGNEKRYKIGRTTDSDVRHKTISATLPEKLERLHEIKTDDVVGIERYWHQRFANNRRKGEWFILSTADVAAFRRRKYQ